MDDIPETRDHLTKLLSFESDIEVVGAAASGAQALELVVELEGDVCDVVVGWPTAAVPQKVVIPGLTRDPYPWIAGQARSDSSAI